MSELLDIGDKTEVINLAKRLINENPGNINNPEWYLNHLETTFEIAYELACKIKAVYPTIPINPCEVALAGGLHDIGKPLNKNHIFHELRGAEFLEELMNKGYEFNPSSLYSASDYHRLTRMIRSHGSVYERWSDPRYALERERFEYIEPVLLLPRTWEEAIVTVADYSNKRGKRVNVKERMEKEGKTRALGILDRVNKLVAGQLSAREIDRFGFFEAK